ncbi:Rpn family recombination-promoting nuclease/putative transposase [Paenibacillus silvae]|uniref:Rpn family recombination-promoting nuclease/putative transposase n=1 Tax=Paenibacillus silvae TaxID=1325358 RepID=UPI002006954D|nr:Rpn family recombination-promoting nuclease/putative transposase [Paenibacillus silvae]MCK6150342.1 Rpn family recombination-promoting nuclease/putative transposase [Paenibacillus silvae]MCK6268640.1 Rpn family recombination-promoting nuclease/putative transposase [Paenibacillus silvae]
MTELLDPRVDFVFKRIFGSEQNKDVLLAFLNSTFIETGEAPLTEITVINTYTDKDSPEDKQSILDIKAKTVEGKLINIEMQLFNPYHMEKRTLFYWSEMYFHQIKKGENYNLLKKCVTINILNYSCLDNERYHNVFHLREDHTGISLTDDIEIHVMELTKLEQHAVPLEQGGLVNWLLFLKGIDTSNWEVLAMNEPMLKKAMDTLEFLSHDAATRMAYDARMKALSDEKSMIEGARAEGLREGKEEMARELLALGVDMSAIVKASGLSEEEIRKLLP